MRGSRRPARHARVDWRERQRRRESDDDMFAAYETGKRVGEQLAEKRFARRIEEIIEAAKSGTLADEVEQWLQGQ